MSNTTKEITEGGWCSDPLLDLQLSWDTQVPGTRVPVKWSNMKFSKLEYLRVKFELLYHIKIF